MLESPSSHIGSTVGFSAGKALMESQNYRCNPGQLSCVFGCGVSHLFIHPGIFRWLGVKDGIVCHSEWWKNAKLHLSPCQAAVGFAVLFLPWPLLLTLSKQLEQILFYWGSYQVQGISAAPVPRLFLSLCRVLRWHPTRAVRSREFAVSLANWILNQNRWGCGLQCVLWHFKQAVESIFTSGALTADLTLWKQVLLQILSTAA